MPPLVYYATEIFAFGSLLLGIFVLFMVGVLTAKHDRSLKPLARYAYLLSFLIALAGVAVSLFYSEIAGYAPCSLCWWQRIFMYPIVVVLGVALWKKEKNLTALWSALILSALGTLTAIYNTYLQFGGTAFLPCPATGPSCAQRYFLEYGFITLPSMGLIGFLAILLLMLIANSVRDQ